MGIGNGATLGFMKNGIWVPVQEGVNPLPTSGSGGGGGGAVDSVNGQTGDVVLGPEDVGAVPSESPIDTIIYNDADGFRVIGSGEGSRIVFAPLGGGVNPTTHISVVTAGENSSVFLSSDNLMASGPISILAGVPTNANHTTTKGYVEANFVPLSTTPSRIYGIGTDGSQALYIIASGAATAFTIPQRGADGVIFVGEPTADAHAATKKYVDEAIAAALGA